jgi:hypothetical protein
MQFRPVEYQSPQFGFGWQEAHSSGLTQYETEGVRLSEHAQILLFDRVDAVEKLQYFWFGLSY